MTAAERKLAARLLRLAADRFSNHGCNDFDMAEVIPDQTERDEIVRAYHEWNGDPQDYTEAGEVADYRLMDWMAMDFMANRLTRDEVTETHESSVAYHGGTDGAEYP
jgi:hypothetical protein